MHRQSLLLIAPHQLRWEDEDIPSPNPDEITVRTLVSAISVGTELPIYQGTQRGHTPISYPRMTGYESVGEVIDCGANVHQFARGERVIAFYGHRTHAVISPERAISIPADIPEAVALLAILGCDTTKGIKRLNPRQEDRVIVSGAGTIGLLTLFNLKGNGIKQVDMVEPLPHRREVARQLGADQVVAPDEAHRLEDNYDIGFECSSRNQAFALLQERLVSKGKLCILADGNIEPLVLTPAFHAKELEVVGSSDGENYPAYAQWFFEQVRRRRPPLEKLFELVTTAEELPDIFEQIAQGQKSPIKVLAHY